MDFTPWPILKLANYQRADQTSGSLDVYNCLVN